MVLSKLFSKFKGLGPVAIVGGAVIITIKLLTTQTPQNEEIIQVKAEEDIKTEDYEEKIEPPKEATPPPAPEEEKKEQPEAEKEQTEDTAEETEEEEGAEDEEEKEKGEDESQEPPKTVGRTWKNNGDPLINMLKGLLGNKNK